MLPEYDEGTPSNSQRFLALGRADFPIAISFSMRFIASPDDATRWLRPRLYYITSYRPRKPRHSHMPRVSHPPGTLATTSHRRHFAFEYCRSLVGFSIDSFDAAKRARRAAL